MSIKSPTGTPRQSFEAPKLTEQGCQLLKKLSYSDVRALNRIFHDKNSGEMRKKTLESIERYALEYGKVGASWAGIVPLFAGMVAGGAVGIGVGVSAAAVTGDKEAVFSAAAGSSLVGGMAAGAVPAAAGGLVTGSIGAGVGLTRSLSKGALSLTGLRVNSYVAHYLNVAAGSGQGVDDVRKVIEINSQ